MCSSDLLPGWSPAWAGRPLEAHGLPTAAGPLSFALRWHGSRPALLWQIDPDGEGAPLPLTVSAAALDPGFAAATTRGEALLAEPAAVPVPRSTEPA